MFLFELDIGLRKANFSRLAQPMHLIIDEVAQVGDILFVGTEVKQVENRSGGGFDHHLTRLATGGNHFYLDIFGERREPQAMTSFHNEQVVMTVNRREACLPLKNLFHRSIDGACVMLEL